MATNRKTLGSIAGLAPADEAFDITPHASNEVAPNRGFVVAVAGNVTLRAVKGSADVVIAAQAGVIYPISVKFIRATGTTATGIVGVN